MIWCIGVCVFLVLGMALLYKRSVWQKIRSPCITLLAFAALGILAEFAAGTDSGGMEAGTIQRKEPSGGELETEAVVYLQQSDTEYTIQLGIPERKYRKSEEQALLAAAVEEIQQTFCGQNSSLEQIVTNPRILDSYQEGAVSAEWLFSDREVISMEGEIDPNALREQAQEVEAAVTLRCGDSEEEYRFSFQIVPGEKSRREQTVREIEKKIGLQEETEAVVRLPETAGGERIEWRNVDAAPSLEFLGLGILAAFATAYSAKERQEKKIQKRKNRLFLAYPEFVSKLSLLLGAGMTISGALRKMNEMYQRRKAQGGREDAVYEELHQMICEMDNGVGELRAYQKFSERCDLQPYRKLVSLLISGQKVGNRKLLKQLNEEADRVFSERRNAARRLGEEAGTKLLIPMMLMLVIVMGIVIIPAFLSIYGV